MAWMIADASVLRNQLACSKLELRSSPSTRQTQRGDLMIEKHYSSEFYQREKNKSRISAEAVVPLVMDWVTPASVIDLGCGIGEWLAVFNKAGVQQIRGVDGNWVPQDELVIPQHAFTEQDLTISYISERRYDLAMSLETAEHLPPESGQSLVRSLTDLAPIVLFSAAIPDQAGINHINCQWPSYWANLFTQRSYVFIDALRFRIWEDSRVAWWYRQNLMIYVHEEELKRWPKLEAFRNCQSDRPLPLVHPEMLREVLDWGLEENRKYWELYLEREQTMK
jgi:hypothetical protein